MVKKITTAGATDLEVKKETSTGGSNPLNDLADEAQRVLEPGDGLEATDTAERLQREAAERAQAEAMQKVADALMASVEKLVHGGLKAVRSRIARKLPEIIDEWTDEALAAPAAAAVPVLHKYLGKWLQVLGDYPEEAALAMSCLPLAIGFAAAVDKHQAAAKTEAP
jgi:hypothetical protein